MVALFPPYRGQVTTTTPIPVQGSQKIHSLGGSGGERRRNEGEEEEEAGKKTVLLLFTLRAPMRAACEN